MDLGRSAETLTVLLGDRGGQFTDAFDHVLAGAGIEVVKTPPQCPRANAYAERWIRTLCAELTDRMLILGERHLRRVLAENLRHHNEHRRHRGLVGKMELGETPTECAVRETLEETGVRGEPTGLRTRRASDTRCPSRPVGALCSACARDLALCRGEVREWIAHCPVSRRRCSSSLPSSSTARMPAAGTSEFALGARGSWKKSVRPIVILLSRAVRSLPRAFEAADVVVEQARAVQAP